MRGRDLVAVILAVGVSTSVMLLSGAAAWAEVDKHLAISKDIATLLSTVLGASVGAVATFVGVRIGTAGVEDLNGSGGGDAAAERPPPPDDTQDLKEPMA